MDHSEWFGDQLGSCLATFFFVGQIHEFVTFGLGSQLSSVLCMCLYIREKKNRKNKVLGRTRMFRYSRYMYQVCTGWQGVNLFFLSRIPIGLFHSSPVYKKKSYLCDAGIDLIGSVHPSESGTITALQGEKGESQLEEKGNVFNTFNQRLTCRIDIYSPFCPLSLS